MTFAGFKKKWARYTGKESSAYQEHFNDLCGLLGHKKLDAVVAAAYGWVRAGRAEADLTDEQILERLLALNLERAAEEAQAAQAKKPKAQREKHAEEML
jgi:Sec-independent protein translocase protein TatA